MKVERKGFCFYKNYWETARLLNKKQRLDWLEGLMKFVFEQEEPNFQEGVLKIAWAAIRPVLQKGNVTANNGVNGGAPKRSCERSNGQDITNEEPKDNQDITNKEPKDTLDTTNEGATKKKLKNILNNTYVNNNIFNKNCEMYVNARAREFSNDERKEWLEQFNEYISSAPPSYADDILEVIDTMLEALEQSKTVKGLCFGNMIYFEKALKQHFKDLTTEDFREVIKSIHFKDKGVIDKKPIYILSVLIARINRHIYERAREKGVLK